MLWYHSGTAIWRNIMTEKVNKTFMEGLLAFLAGLPGAINVVLKIVSESMPVGGKFVQPAFWLLVGYMIFGTLLEMTGLSYLVGDLLGGAGQGAIDLVTGIFTASSPPVAAVVIDVPITVEEAVAALKAAAALGTDVPVVLTAQ